MCGLTGSSSKVEWALCLVAVHNTCKRRVQSAVTIHSLTQVSVSYVGGGRTDGMILIVIAVSNKTVLVDIICLLCCVVANFVVKSRLSFGYMDVTFCQDVTD